MIELNKIPEKSGVYIFKDLENSILYVGKAKNLKKRISSYFNKKINDLKTELLVKKISSVEWIITENEIEALILENNLIKKHKPPFNIKLADDKTYPYIKINLNIDFPKIEITRRKDDKNALYFGPYTSAFALKQTVNFIHKNFKLRKCNERKFKSRIRPCLNYQINLCCAPCCGFISKDKYKEIFNEAILFLKGETDKLIEILKKRMNYFSENLNFEKAAEIRDLIFNVEKFIENQKQSVELNEFVDTDVFCYKIDFDDIYFYVLKLKQGKIIGSDFYKFSNILLFGQNPLEEFIPKYYLNKSSIPDRIIIPEKGIKVFLKEFIKRKFKRNVEIIIDKNSQLIKLCNENLIARIDFEKQKIGDLEKIKKVLKLKNLPGRIDAFDVSTFSGKESVGGRIVYKNGDFLKNYYRRYKIKTVENEINDFAMMYEIVSRSINEYIEKDEYPDLMLIDGGKGQLNVSYKALKEAGLDNKIDIVSIAKSDGEFDKIYLVNRKNSLNLKKYPGIIKFFMKIRDEVHRFAIKYHRKRDEMEKFKKLA